MTIAVGMWNPDANRIEFLGPEFAYHVCRELWGDVFWLWAVEWAPKAQELRPKPKKGPIRKRKDRDVISIVLILGGPRYVSIKRWTERVATDQVCNVRNPGIGDDRATKRYWTSIRIRRGDVGIIQCRSTGFLEDTL